MDVVARGGCNRDRGKRLDSAAVGDAAVSDATAVAALGAAVADAQLVRAPSVPFPYHGRPHPSCPK